MSASNEGLLAGFEPSDEGATSCSEADQGDVVRFGGCSHLSDVGCRLVMSTATIAVRGFVSPRTVLVLTRQGLDAVRVYLYVVQYVSVRTYVPLIFFISYFIIFGSERRLSTETIHSVTERHS